MKILFIGTSTFACPALEALHSHSDHNVVAVITQPDRPAGRHQVLTAPPVKELALKLHVPISQPPDIKAPHVREQVRLLQPELIVVAAYGQILPPEFLSIPRLGCLNIHGSLLPKYRGAAPIQWALLCGESKTGVTIMQVSEKLDSGHILTQLEVSIRRRDNSKTLHDKLAILGAKLLLKTIPDYASGKIIPQPQPPSPTPYARKFKKEELLLDWNQSPFDLWLKIRAFAPSPGAYSYVQDGCARKLLKIFDVIISRHTRCQPGQIGKVDQHGILVGAHNGALLLREIQLEGRKRLRARDLANSGLFQTGQFLG